MTARSRRRALAVLLAALALPGCFSGHLLAHGRRRAEADAIRAVERMGTGIVVGWDGRVTDDYGRTLARGTWWSAVRDGGGEVAAVGAPAAGAVVLPTCAAARADAACAEVVVDDAGDLALRVRGPSGVYAVPLAGLTRVWTTPWTYALMPVAIAADTIAMPFFVVMTPAAWLLGD
jgi:hypothetical protein